MLPYGFNYNIRGQAGGSFADIAINLPVMLTRRRIGCTMLAASRRVRRGTSGAGLTRGHSLALRRWGRCRDIGPRTGDEVKRILGVT